jgi:hypothetical protein
MNKESVKGLWIINECFILLLVPVLLGYNKSNRERKNGSNVCSILVTHEYELLEYWVRAYFSRVTNCTTEVLSIEPCTLSSISFFFYFSLSFCLSSFQEEIKHFFEDWEFFEFPLLITHFKAWQLVDFGGLVDNILSLLVNFPGMITWSSSS